MGLPAARAIVDTGAHSAPILKGSLNVLISGFQAARKGDSITCPSPDHAQAAIITNGSSTVFINGLPAARFSDETGCGAPPLPPVAGPPSAPSGISGNDSKGKSIDEKMEDDEHRVSAWNVNANDSSAKVLTAAAAQYDEEGMTGGKAEASVLSGKAECESWKVEGKALHGEADGKIYHGNGSYGYEGTAEANMYKADAQLSHTEGDTTVGGKATVKGPSAKAKAKRVFHTGEKGKWGYEAEIGAGASMISGDVEGEIRKGEESIKGGIGGSVESVGAEVGAGFVYNSENDTVNIKGIIDGELGLGVDLSFDVTLKKDTLITAYGLCVIGGPGIGQFMAMAYLVSHFWPSPPPVPGTILSGCPTVLIGG